MILKTKIIEFNMESPLFVTSIGTKKRLDLDLLFSENYIYEDVKPNPDIKTVLGSKYNSTIFLIASAFASSCK